MSLAKVKIDENKMQKENKNVQGFFSFRLSFSVLLPHRQMPRRAIANKINERIKCINAVPNDEQTEQNKDKISLN